MIIKDKEKKDNFYAEEDKKSKNEERNENKGVSRVSDLLPNNCKNYYLCLLFLLLNSLL